MKRVDLIFMAILALPVFAHSRVVCDSRVTSQIEACAESNFNESDAELNRTYQAIEKKSTGTDRKNLQKTQRFWIQYKIQYCQAAFDQASPGQEAGIDKWACLESVTSTRTRELLFLDNSYGMKDFRQAVTFMANEYENGDEGRVLNRLAQDTLDGQNLDWLRYVEANCEMTRVRIREERDVCMARMNFYKNW